MDNVFQHEKLIDLWCNFFSGIKKHKVFNQVYLAALINVVGEMPLHIMLADDDDDDRLFFREAMQTVSSKVKLTTTNDGDELLKVLKKSADNLPDLIFLDLNMPLKNGFECLEEIRSIKAMKDIPVLIYSTSAQTAEIDRAYNKGANLYIQKPSNFEDIKHILKKIFSFDLEELLSQPKRESFLMK